MDFRLEMPIARFNLTFGTGHDILPVDIRIGFKGSQPSSVNLESKAPEGRDQNRSSDKWFKGTAKLP
jgi:hypothetical protein